MNLLIGGKAGEGVDVTGQILASAVSASGWFFHANSEIQNVIQGYHNTLQLTLSEEPLVSHAENYDLILALDQETLENDVPKLKPGGMVVYDAAWSWEAPQGMRALAVPFSELVAAAEGTSQAKNMVGLGAIAGLLGLDEARIVEALKHRFENKDEKIIQQNVAAVHAGYMVAQKFDGPVGDLKLTLRKQVSPTMIVSGNMLAAMAAIKAGCKFFAAYPMTPSTGILHFLAKHAAEYGVLVHHVEDELAAINQAIGAGYAGVRSMTATSGGGYALMTEAIGLSGMLEVPVVLVEVQRPGPSTGLPTRTGQGDLRQVLHAGQGDFPHIVMSPGAHAQVFPMVFEAFNLAERYQCPVTVLMEKYLAENFVNLEWPKQDGLEIDHGKITTVADGEYKRYALTDDGISPRCVPGTVGGSHTETSYEHREDGYFTEEAEKVKAMNDKRARKLETLSKQLPVASLEGQKDADVTLVCWGATYGPAQAALSLLSQRGISANLLQVKYLRPLQPGISEILGKAKRLIIVEGNASAQLGGLLREKTGVEIRDQILDYSGRPFTAEQIAERVAALMSKV